MNEARSNWTILYTTSANEIVVLLNVLKFERNKRIFLRHFVYRKFNLPLKFSATLGAVSLHIRQHGVYGLIAETERTQKSER